MAETPHIIVRSSLTAQQQAQIRAAAGTETVDFSPDADLSAARIVGGDVSDADLAAAPDLRWVHSWAAGPGRALVDRLAATDVVLTSSKGNGAIPLAEHAMMLMLMLNRDCLRWLTAQREHSWDRFTHSELAGKTCGIIGLGHSGADLAQKARAFHMRVIGVRRQPAIPVEGVERIYGPDQLDEFLPQCDFVVVTAPGTPQTDGMLDAAAFRSMKETSYYICFSRGGIADDDALLQALNEGWIAGAGLDAHSIEPLPADSPFWTAPNSIVTPHNGATTEETRQRGVDIFADNLRRHVAGEELVNRVDLQAGY